MSGKKRKANYTYCTSCERAYKKGMYRIADDPLFDGQKAKLCPSKDCDNYYKSNYPWEQYRYYNPEVLEIPEIGKVYE